MKSIEVDPAVVVEIAEAAAWYETQREGLGRRFAADVERTLERLPTSQLRQLQDFRRYEAKSVRLWGPWPYRFVVIERSALWVVALVHDRRQPGSWLSRLQGG